VLTVPASHEGTQKTTEDRDTFYFHCVKAWEPVLKVRLQVMGAVQYHRSYCLLISSVTKTVKNRIVSVLGIKKPLVFCSL